MKINNPAFNYDKTDVQYSAIRKTDPHIEQLVFQVLGSAQTIVNVGAGGGSYEPLDKFVMAVEPSANMRKQRLSNGLRPALDAKADALPLDDNSFDAAMAMVTIHHWPDIRKGLAELQRVSKDKVLILTFDPDELNLFWNAHYFQELIEVEKARYPKIESIKDSLKGDCQVISVPIPLNCLDGFQEAFYGRPEAFLNPAVRKAQSAWGFLDSGMEEVLVERLSNDLKSGKWDEQWGQFRKMPFFTGALKLIVCKK